MNSGAGANKRVAIVGNPNSGKTTLFNRLSGLNQKVGNYPGVTVDKVEGYFSHDNQKVTLIDLPGCYSISSRSEDEKVTSDFLNGGDYDVILYVGDSTNLKRSLFFFTQLYSFGKPLVLALNFQDEADKKGVNIDVKNLQRQLDVNTVSISAKKNSGIDELKRSINEANSVSKNEDFNQLSILKRYEALDQLLHGSVVKSEQDHYSVTDKLDKVLVHPIWGYLFFLLILGIIFQMIFYVSEYPMMAIEKLFLIAESFISTSLPEGPFTSLLAKGIIPGLGGVLVFIPQIALLFFFLSLLEESGYMARVSLLTDKLMRPFGLNGRSVIPLISATACAIPAIMSSRTISNYKERLLTIFVTPLISCSARLPVYTLIIALVIPDEKIFGFIDMKGFTLLFLYLLGFLFALITAAVLSRFFKKNEQSIFVMELPKYRFPSFRNSLLIILEKVKIFVFDAGKVILAISIVLWVLSSYGPNTDQNGETIMTSISEVENISESYAGKIGKSFEPIIEPLGYNWKIGIAIITSFAAREVFVGTLATIYSVSEENTTGLKERMMQEINPDTGLPVFTLATGISLLIFYVFALQCISTIAVVKRETKGWKWPIIQLVYLSLLAYSSAFLAYNFLS